MQSVVARSGAVLASSYRLALVFAVTLISLLVTQRSEAIVFSKIVDIKENPAVVQVLYGHRFICTGTLIAPKIVLTAKHCVSSGDEEYDKFIGDEFPFEVVFNRQRIDLFDGESIDVAQHIQHPAGKRKKNKKGKRVGYLPFDDIALLQLQKAPTGVQPLPLATSATQLTPGTKATIAGWGMTKNFTLMDMGDARIPFRQAETVIRTPSQCDKARRVMSKGSKKKRAKRVYFDPKSVICVGYKTDPHPAPCYGDSGGPLIVNGAVAGVVSYGQTDQCGYGVDIYGNVAFGNPASWLQAQLRMGTLDNDPPTDIATPLAARAAIVECR